MSTISTATACPTRMRSRSPVPSVSSVSRGRTAWATTCAPTKVVWKNPTSAPTVARRSQGDWRNAAENSRSCLTVCSVHYIYWIGGGIYSAIYNRRIKFLHICLQQSCSWSCEAVLICSLSLFPKARPSQQSRQTGALLGATLQMPCMSIFSCYIPN